MTKCAKCNNEIKVEDTRINLVIGGVLCSDCAECEACNGIAFTYIHGMYLCEDCRARETKSRQNQASANLIVNEMNDTLIKAEKIDTALQIRTDLFNAETVSIADIKRAIDSDDSIENKSYELAAKLKERIQKYNKVIFELNEETIATANKQRAVQTHLNTLANSLRTEEREKLKLADISYKPREVKITKPKVSPGNRIDKNEIRRYALELKVSEFTLQMLCVAKGLSPEQAANQLRRSINESKSETN